MWSGLSYVWIHQILLNDVWLKRNCKKKLTPGSV